MLVGVASMVLDGTSQVVQQGLPITLADQLLPGSAALLVLQACDAAGTAGFVGQPNRDRRLPIHQQGLVDLRRRLQPSAVYIRTQPRARVQVGGQFC